MVPVERSRQLLAVAACAAGAVVVTAIVAAKEPHGGAAETAAAFVLAVTGTAVAALAASRLAGSRLAVGAAAVYALLPALANRFMLPQYRATFDHDALPAIVGLQTTWALALGVALTAVAALAPARLAGSAGVAAAAISLALWAGRLGALRPALHESVWSVALLEWLLVASIVAVLLRSPERGAGFAGLLVAAVCWGAHRGYDGGAFWRSLALAAPAAAVCLSSLALLVPRLRPAPRRSQDPSAT